MSLENALSAAIYGALHVPAVTSLATGGVWEDGPPEGTAPPYVVFSVSAGSDVGMFDRTGHQVVYLVRGIVRNLWPKDANAIAAAIDAQLQNKRIAVAGGQTLLVQREGPFAQREDLGGGIVYQHRGATYRWWVDEAV